MIRRLVVIIPILLMLAAGLALVRLVTGGGEVVDDIPEEVESSPLTEQPPVVAARQDVTVVVSAGGSSSGATRPATAAAQPYTAGQPTATPQPDTAAPTDFTPSTWRITPPGCCSGARWAADSARVLFYHRPDDAPVGLWSADTSGTLTYLQPNFGHLSADNSIIVSRNGGITLIEALDGSGSRPLHNDGVNTLPAPDGRHVAYLARLGMMGRNDPQHRLMVAAVDGGEPITLLDLARADHLYWLPDSQRLVVFGWRPEGTSPGLWTVDISTGASKQIVQANYLTAVEVAPDGGWIAYLATLQPNAGDNGLWIVRPDGSERRHTGFSRAARWAADSQALLAMVPSGGGKELRRIELDGGAQTVIVGRAHADIDIEADDWSVAPDGRLIVYRSPRDRALWLLQIAP